MRLRHNGPVPASMRLCGGARSGKFRRRDRRLRLCECGLALDRVQWAVGGVSIPMTIANRLTTNGSRSFVVIQRDKSDFPPCRFAAALGRLGPIAYRAGQVSEGVVIISPLGIERGDAIHLMALAGE